MKTIYHFTAKAYFRTKARCHVSIIYDNIPAKTAEQALKEFTDAWSPHTPDGSISLTDIRQDAVGVSYSVGEQPNGYKAFGYSFRDGDISEVRAYEKDRSLHFLTRSKTCDLSIGLNWTETDFHGTVEKLKTELWLN